MSFAELLDDTFKAPSSHGMSNDELIRSFISLDKQYKELSGQRKDLAMQIAGIAFENKGEQDTARVASTDGQSIKVVFGKDFTYDTEMMKDVLELLGAKEFDSLFSTEIKFSAKKRALKMFLNTTWPEEAKETAKAIIRDATVAKDKLPYVSVEMD